MFGMILLWALCIVPSSNVCCFVRFKVSDPQVIVGRGYTGRKPGVGDNWDVFVFEDRTRSAESLRSQVDTAFDLFFLRGGMRGSTLTGDLT